MDADPRTRRRRSRRAARYAVALAALAVGCQGGTGTLSRWRLANDDAIAPPPTAEEAGETIAKKGPAAVALAKRVLQQGQDADLRTAHALETAAFGLVFASDDRAEGMDAFLEKRPPKFTGR